MVLTSFQRRVLKALAANRSPNSLFVGGSVINRETGRRSDDLDIEDRSADAVRASYEADRDALRRLGFDVRVTAKSHPEHGFIEAEASSGAEGTLLNWMWDTAVRFLPAIEDDLFGWRLHDADLAVNKLLALAGRREARDYVDVVHLHGNGFPLAALAWAAMGKDAGMSPSLVLDEASRNSRYAVEELEREVSTPTPLDPVALKAAFLSALREARDAAAKMTALRPDVVGRLCVDRSGRVVVPDARRLETGEVSFHAATLAGAWPSFPAP